MFMFIYRGLSTSSAKTEESIYIYIYITMITHSYPSTEYDHHMHMIYDCKCTLDGSKHAAHKYIYRNISVQACMLKIVRMTAHMANGKAWVDSRSEREKCSG
jgi:hypothetical protein